MKLQKNSPYNGQEFNSKEINKENRRKVFIAAGFVTILATIGSCTAHSCNRLNENNQDNNIEKEWNSGTITPMPTEIEATEIPTPTEVEEVPSITAEAEATEIPTPTAWISPTIDEPIVDEPIIDVEPSITEIPATPTPWATLAPTPKEPEPTKAPTPTEEAKITEAPEKNDAKPSNTPEPTATLSPTATATPEPTATETPTKEIDLEMVCQTYKTANGVILPATKTNKDVTVTVSFNKEIVLTNAQIKSGWVLSADGKTISKVYKTNEKLKTNEILEIADEKGNKKDVSISIDIDKTILRINTQNYATIYGTPISSTTKTNTSVKVMVSFNKKVVLTSNQIAAGWKLLADGKTISKTYSPEENSKLKVNDFITITDEYGNQETVRTTVDIDKTKLETINQTYTTTNGTISSTTKTDKDVKVTVVFNKRVILTNLQIASGWKTSIDGKTISKVYSPGQNSVLKVNDTLEFKDEYGNTKVINATVDIDRTINQQQTAPTVEPTKAPSNTPTVEPTKAPSNTPTVEPTKAPSNTPTVEPTKAPSNTPTVEPTKAPSNTPTVEPTKAPSNTPTVEPTKAPSNTPTAEPTKAPSNTPTVEPTKAPSNTPTAEPTKAPSNTPTVEPTKAPSNTPTVEPTKAPSNTPTAEATKVPTPTPFNGTTDEDNQPDIGEVDDKEDEASVEINEPLPSPVPTPEPTNEIESNEVSKLKHFKNSLQLLASKFSTTKMAEATKQMVLKK